MVDKVATETEFDLLTRLLQDRAAPLHPDLEPYLFDSVHGLGQVLQHPLVYQVPFYSAAMANYQYEQKEKAIQEALDEENWSQFLWLHERPYRVDAFLRIEDRMDDESYWGLLRDAWIDTENAWQNLNEWRDLFRSTRPGREHLMDDDERLVLSEMPDPFTVYRGCLEELNEDGFSYTMQRPRAVWFAKRFAEMHEAKPIVIVAQVWKEDVFAVLHGRNEYEVVVDDEKIDVVRYEEV